MRYHIMRGKRETTVTVDDILAEMLALKLGHDPDSETANRAVQEWLQNRLDQSHDPRRPRLSQWLQAEIVDSIVSPKLRQAWGDWFDRAEKAGTYRQRRGPPKRR